MRTSKKLLSLVVVAVAVLLATAPARGAGFNLLEHGARASSLGGAVVARADDLSALFFNPAGLTQLPGLQVMAGVTLIAPSTAIETRFGPFTSTTKMREDLFFPPHLYVSYQVSPRVWLGLGLFSPFGLGVRFEPHWPGRFNNIQTTISTLNINPTAAFKLTELLSVAVGLDVMSFNFYHRRVLPLPFPAGFQDTALKGDSWGMGFNVGLHFKPTDYLSAGISYRSQVKQTVGGNATFFPAGFLNAAMHGSITLPDEVFTGVMVRLLPRLTLEAGTVWTHWRLFHQFNVDVRNSLGTITEPKDWHDAWRVQTGLEYRAADWLDLRLGYAFDEDPIPGKFADYIVPASNRHYFSVGTGFRWRQATLDLSYTYMFMEDKKIPGSAAIGFLPSVYRDRRAHLVGLSLGYKF